MSLTLKLLFIDLCFLLKSHYAKSVQIGSFFWSVFPVFGLNTGRYSISLRIYFECRKIRTRKNSVFGHFSHSESLSIKFLFQRCIAWPSLTNIFLMTGGVILISGILKMTLQGKRLELKTCPLNILCSVDPIKLNANVFGVLG